MSALLSAIVLVFFICHSTKIVTHTYEAYQVPAPSTSSRYQHPVLGTSPQYQ